MALDKETYRIFEHITDVDISEQDIWDYEPDVLNKLLIDHTMSAQARAESNDQSKFVNIFWATHDYEAMKRMDEGNEGYRYDDQIMPEKIIGQNGRVIMPRVLNGAHACQDKIRSRCRALKCFRCRPSPRRTASPGPGSCSGSPRRSGARSPP